MTPEPIPAPAERVGGVVLCGGLSSRMGRPKVTLPFGEEVMLQRVVRVLCEAVEPVVVVAASGQDVPPLPAGVRIMRDEVEGKGPLAGLAAGLAALAGEVDAVYLSACDAPLLKPAFVRRVVSLLTTDACLPRVGDRLHPLAAAYRVGVLSVVREMLAADRLRMLDLFDRIPTRFLGPDDLADADPHFDSLRNVNTPDEYEAALRLQFSSPGP